MGKTIYKSPTDMGVNMAGHCIVDDDVVQEASRQEVIRRYYNAQIDVKKGLANKEVVSKIEILMQKLQIGINDREVVKAALDKEAITGSPACALQLPDGTMVTGKTSDLLGSAAATILNALKVLGNIDDSIDLISSTVIQPIQELKVNHMGAQNPRLHPEEILMALAVSAVTNPMAKHALGQLSNLKCAQMHSTVTLSNADSRYLKKLGIDVTCEPKSKTDALFPNAK
jgi:uncharacterized protein (UPF0371 family)